MDSRFGYVSCALLILMALASSCGVYSMSSGRVDDTVRKVYVPFLENATSEPDVGIDLTERIIQSLQDDNTLKIVAEEDASSILKGRVITYRVKEAFASQTSSNNLQVDEYQIQIQVELTFEILETGEELFAKKKIRGTGNYAIDGSDGTTEERPGTRRPRKS